MYPDEVALEMLRMELTTAELLITELGALIADEIIPADVSTPAEVLNPALIKLLPPAVCTAATLVLPTPIFTKYSLVLTELLAVVEELDATCGVLVSSETESSVGVTEVEGLLKATESLAAEELSALTGVDATAVLDVNGDELPEGDVETWERDGTTTGTLREVSELDALLEREGA